MKAFSVATFNLLNLNEPGLPMYGNAQGWSPEQYQQKVAWTAHQLAMLQADVIAFQELWHAQALEAVFAQWGVTPPYQLLIPPQTQGRATVCAAAVRQGIALESVQWLQDFPDDFVLSSSGGDAQTPAIRVAIQGFSRPVLHARLKLHPKEPLVHVYVCHFKSKRPTDLFREPWYDKAVHGMHHQALGAAASTIRRTAEAAALRMVLTQVMKHNDAPVIVLGDINDGYGSNTQNILTEQPRYLLGDAKGGGDTALYSAHTLQGFRDTRDVLYTYSHQGMKDSLDHIFFSQAFYPQSAQRRWLFEGLSIHNDHLDAADHKANGSSDHGIVKASFKYRPVKKTLKKSR